MRLFLALSLATLTVLSVFTGLMPRKRYEKSWFAASVFGADMLTAVLGFLLVSLANAFGFDPLGQYPGGFSDTDASGLLVELLLPNLVTCSIPLLAFGFGRLIRYTTEQIEKEA